VIHTLHANIWSRFPTYALGLVGGRDRVRYERESNGRLRESGEEEVLRYVEFITFKIVQDKYMQN
jgi:hypothetical protein